MNIEELIINIVSGAYIKNNSKGKFVFVKKKKEMHIGSHLVMPLVDMKLLMVDEKQHYRLNKKFFLPNGDIDDLEFRIFMSEWKKKADKRRKAMFANEPRPNSIVLSLTFLGGLLNDFNRWYKDRIAYLKRVEAILNDD